MGLNISFIIKKTKIILSIKKTKIVLRIVTLLKKI